jgi:hypothetical protein
MSFCFNYHHHHVHDIIWVIFLLYFHVVDVIGVPAPCLLRACCCAKGKDILELQTAKALLNGKMVLTLKGGEGDGVSEIIMNQVEESQVMERD